jgi:hypothetical protein
MLLRGLVVPEACVIPRPPIGAAGGVSLLAEPVAITAIGVVVIVIVGTVDPDPHAIPKHPMTMTIALTMIVVAISIERLTSATVVAIAPRARTV